MNNINNSDNLNLTAPETWITKSFFLISQGSFRGTMQYLDHFEHANY